jgi:hypothetical protein
MDEAVWSGWSVIRMKNLDVSYPLLVGAFAAAAVRIMKIRAIL